MVMELYPEALNGKKRNHRRRSGAVLVNQRVRRGQSAWNSVDWNTLPTTLQQLHAIRNAAEEEMKHLRFQIDKWRDAYLDLFKKLHGSEPARRDDPPSKMSLGEWLVTLDVKYVILIQRQVRRWRMLRRLKDLAKKYYESDETLPLRHRNDVIRELLMSEKAYVDYLRILVTEFQERLDAAAAEGTLKGKDDFHQIRAHVATIFGNAKDIYAYNKAILAQLQEEWKKWPSAMSVGDIFVNMAPYLRLYSTFVNGYDKSLEAISKLERTTNFKQIVEEIKKRSGCGHTLEMLLAMPVQRIPRYELLLKQLLMLTPKEHKDYNLLTEALDTITETAKYINEEKRRTDFKDSLLKLQSKIQGCPDLLSNPDRRMIQKIKVHFNVLSSVFKKKKALFVFNDMLMVCGVGMTGLLIYEAHYSLNQLSIVDHDNEETCAFALLWVCFSMESYKTYATAFEIQVLSSNTHKIKKKFIATTETKEVKRAFLLMVEDIKRNLTHI